MAYNNPISSTYSLKAQAISSAATLMTIVGPKGYKGRLVGIGAALTTATTDAASELRVGTGADADKYGTLTVGVAAIGSVHNNAAISAIDSNIIPADSAVVFATDGGSTAGAGDLFVTIDWFK